MVRAVALATSLIIAGCGWTQVATEPKSTPGTGTGSALNPNVESLGVSVSLSTHDVKPGEPVRVAVVLDNHGLPPFKITFGTGCQFTWIITATDGQVIQPDHICTMATSYLEFGSDGLYSVELSIRTVRDGEPDWPFGEDELPVGRYKLEVYLYGYERRMNTEEVWFNVVE
jgi:hypothetical protein